MLYSEPGGFCCCASAVLSALAPTSEPFPVLLWARTMALADALCCMLVSRGCGAVVPAGSGLLQLAELRLAFTRASMSAWLRTAGSMADPVTRTCNGHHTSVSACVPVLKKHHDAQFTYRYLYQMQSFITTCTLRYNIQSLEGTWLSSAQLCLLRSAVAMLPRQGRCHTRV